MPGAQLITKKSRLGILLRIRVTLWTAAAQGWLGWAGAGSHGNGAARASRIPRSISSLIAGPSAGAVSWQLQVRLPNGFGWVPDEFGSALAAAAPTRQQPRTIAAPTSIFVIRTLVSEFGNPRADCFGFAINMTILL
jgi:hypothetical protein